MILDGEIVPLRGEQIGPFQDLQKRLGRKTPSEEVLRAIPVVFVAYDALFGPDHVRLEEAFSTRRAWLESLPFDETAHDWRRRGFSTRSRPSMTNSMRPGSAATRV